MSGAKSAIDVMTAEDTALLDSMRNDTDAPEIEVVADQDDLGDLEAAPEAEEAPIADATEPEAGAESVVKKKPTTADRFRALTKERDEARALASDAERARAVSEGIVTERLRLLTEAAQSALQVPQAPPAAPVPIEIPDINTDPVGHFKAQLEVLQRKATEQEAILQGFNQQQEQQRRINELRAWGSAQEAELMSREPDYNEAMDFMKAQRRKQLAALKITSPEHQEQVIGSDVTNIALRARAEGFNFAEQMYAIAESYGYQKKAAPTTSAVPVIPPLDAGLPAADRAAAQERGRANSTTIATVGASTPVGLTPDRIASMSDAQFAKHIEGLRAANPTALRDLMGH